MIDVQDTEAVNEAVVLPGVAQVPGTALCCASAVLVLQLRIWWLWGSADGNDLAPAGGKRRVAAYWPCGGRCVVRVRNYSPFTQITKTARASMEPITVSACCRRVESWSNVLLGLSPSHVQHELADMATAHTAASSYHPLDYEQQILEELTSEDGLCITAAGLGWHRVAAAMLAMHDDPQHGESQQRGGPTSVQHWVSCMGSQMLERVTVNANVTFL